VKSREEKGLSVEGFQGLKKIGLELQVSQRGEKLTAPQTEQLPSRSRRVVSGNGEHTKKKQLPRKNETRGGGKKKGKPDSSTPG